MLMFCDFFFFRFVLMVLRLYSLIVSWLYLIYYASRRYNAFWLPLLAKHSENPVSEDPIVVPLDCEWIWHCHRLNPVRLLEINVFLFPLLF